MIFHLIFRDSEASAVKNSAAILESDAPAALNIKKGARIHQHMAGRKCQISTTHDRAGFWRCFPESKERN